MGADVLTLYKSREDRVGEFNKAAGKEVVTFNGDTEAYEADMTAVDNEIDFFMEEVHELIDAWKELSRTYLTVCNNPTGISGLKEFRTARENFVKEWADAQVTLSNIGWITNINGNEAFQRVHNSNMSKVVEGQIIKDPDTGKVLKPDTYVKPDMSGL